MVFYPKNAMRHSFDICYNHITSGKISVHVFRHIFTHNKIQLHTFRAENMSTNILSWTSYQ